MNQQFYGVARTIIAGSLLAVAGCAEQASDRAGQSFDTPEEAVAAFVAAIETHDVDGMRQLLDPGTEVVLSSGDTVADRREREAFLARYRAQHRLVAGGPDNLVLMTGEDDWPMPIPIVRRDGRWRFDGAAGVHELLVRRIGANELIAGLRTRLPRHDVVAVPVAAGANALGRLGDLLGEFVDAGSLAVALTRPADLRGVAAHVSSHLRADRVLMVSFTLTAGANVHEVWTRGSAGVLGA